MFLLSMYLSDLLKIQEEVWHQTSGGKGTNTLREVQVGFHLVMTNKAHEALTTAIDPAGEFSPDGKVVRVGLYLGIRNVNVRPCPYV